jgi:hypothetical protein
LYKAKVSKTTSRKTSSEIAALARSFEEEARATRRIKADPSLRSG